MTLSSLTAGFGKTLGRDVPASFVVFLVAMPLCMGIALASGVPVERGLVTGIVGGIVVGLLAGSPLQVSGPAAGLAVIVFAFVGEYGLAMLGPIVAAAGLVQVLAGTLRLGQWFRVISPAVVHGMLAGIGILIVLAQLHVVMDLAPLAGGVENLSAIPKAVTGLWADGPTGSAFALLVGLSTMAAMLGWERWRPAGMGLVPGALVGVATGAAVAAVFALPVLKVEVPQAILSEIVLPAAADWARLAEPGILAAVLVIAVIASAETLLSAAAVDRMHDGPRTAYNRELLAQGVGNAVCGLLGALPMTGVIVRSSANVQAGAMTRLSAILHGVWILGFVLLLPSLLALIPLASLAAVLLVVGWRLVSLSEVRTLFHRHGLVPPAIWTATVVTIVATDLLYGVLVGLALSLIDVAPQLLRRFRVDPGTAPEVATAADGSREMRIEGAATFPKLPGLLSALEGMPRGETVAIKAGGCTFIDHTCAETMHDWVKRETALGRSVSIEPPRAPASPRVRRRFEALGFETAKPAAA